MSLQRNLLEKLTRRTVHAPQLTENLASYVFKLPIYDLSCETDVRAVDTLLENSPWITIHDTLSLQVQELIQIRNPRIKNSEELSRLADEYARAHPHDSVWIHFPWNNKLVHCLSESSFLEVRRNRNLYLVTPSEAEELMQRSIAIIGLSVGAATAITMAMEGIGRSFHLADFDGLSLSNTNRIRSSIYEVGESKTSLCARNMLEINPFLQIRIFPEGLTKDNVSDFLCNVDLLVELCDDVYTKLFSREEACKRKIPTLMETSIRGMLDVERFDLEPGRLPLHGLMNGVSSDVLQTLSSSQKIKYLLPIVGGLQVLSTRMAASLVEQNQTLCSWPQLASAIQLGSGIASDTSRRILIGENIGSGRYFVDLEKLVPAQKLVRSPSPPNMQKGEMFHGSTVLLCKAAHQKPTLHKPSPRYKISEVHKSALLDAAETAPSGGNTQPWCFRWEDDSLECRPAESSLWSTLDHQGKAIEVALGAAMENIVLWGHKLGYTSSLEIRRLPNESLIICSSFWPASRIATPIDLDLASYIHSRRTNRSNHDLSQKVNDNDLVTLKSIMRQSDAEIEFKTSLMEIQKLQKLIGRMDKICLLHATMHEELTSEVYDPSTLTTPATSGISIDDLGMSEASKIGFQVTKPPEVSKLLKQVNGGEAFTFACMEKVTAVWGLLSQKNSLKSTYFDGGRSMQRMWLKATSLGLAIHPWSGSLYIFARLTSGGESIFTPSEIREIKAIRKEFLVIFPEAANMTEILLFRLGFATQVPGEMVRRGISANQ